MNESFFHDEENNIWEFVFTFNHEITSYKVFNNKVVVTTFDDGSIEKSVCDDEDNFCLETGLSICILKHMYGGSGAYNRMIRAIIKKQEDSDKAEAKREEEENNRKLAKEKSKAKKARKRKEKQIEIFKEALIRANKEIKDGETNEN